MAGKFEIYKDKKGEFRFRLKAGNGEIVLASEGYSSKTGCKNGIASVQKNSPTMSNFDASVTRGGKHRFNLKAANGRVIGTSQSYADEKGCKAGMRAVKSACTKAKMEDKTV